ncbi:hypothetical protein [Enterovibrio norvegicus]|uniref:hypothetical protein n=1 Tax=Enterovibrio norvegicus TaxID=188144 RepID=UPI00352DFBD1
MAETFTISGFSVIYQCHGVPTSVVNYGPHIKTLKSVIEDLTQGVVAIEGQHGEGKAGLASVVCSEIPNTHLIDGRKSKAISRYRQAELISLVDPSIIYVLNECHLKAGDELTSNVEQHVRAGGVVITFVQVGDDVTLSSDLTLARMSLTRERLSLNGE